MAENKTKNRLPNIPFEKAINGTTSLAPLLIKGMRLSEVRYISPSELIPNPLNTQFFNDETVGYFEKLSQDISERGILVPLIAKRNKMLLAGNNRLEIAHELKLKRIPVQFVEEELDESQEREFIIKDNLLRRQLTNDEKLSLYRVLYPNFESRIAMRHDITPATVDVVHPSGLKPLTAKKIAEDTGQNVGTVQKQLQRIDAKNRATQREAALDSIERTPQQIVARQNEFQKFIRVYSSDLMERVKLYNDVLDQQARQKLASALRKLADKIEMEG